MRLKTPLLIDPDKIPRVLMLGNGVLQLAGGGSWGALLDAISSVPVEKEKLTEVPYAMQPECLCGVDVEEVQRKTASAIQDSQVHTILRQLVEMPFDAILTTNYTYEIEDAITGGKWDDRQRRKAFCALDGNTHVHHNTCICNLVTGSGGRTIPVFHLHGERLRKHSLVLSYYSYANAVSRLVSLNKQRGNAYQEKQEANEPLQVLSWLDYFLMGDVYGVGFGFDTSEFDIWWAIERKAREKAKHGRLCAYMITNHDRNLPHEILFEAMAVRYKRLDAVSGYENAYIEAVKDIAKEIG